MAPITKIATTETKVDSLKESYSTNKPYVTEEAFTDSSARNLTLYENPQDNDTTPNIFTNRLGVCSEPQDTTYSFKLYDPNQEEIKKKIPIIGDLFERNSSWEYYKESRSAYNNTVAPDTGNGSGENLINALEEVFSLPFYIYHSAKEILKPGPNR
jgi:hypothetical protein